jgi:AcrR family transcriptional regulator
MGRMPTERGVRRSAAERAEQLIDVAEALFISKGYDRTSIGDIAAAAGVSRPVVYEYHGSKEGLYVAALQRAKRRLMEDYAAALAGLRDPHEILRAAADVWFSFVERDPDRWILLYGGSAVPLTGDLGERLASVNAAGLGTYVGAIKQWVRPDVSDRSIEVTAHLIFGAAHQLARWFLENPDVNRDEVVERFADFCWAGMAPLLPGASDA